MDNLREKLAELEPKDMDNKEMLCKYCRKKLSKRDISIYGKIGRKETICGNCFKKAIRRRNMLFEKERIFQNYLILGNGLAQKEVRQRFKELREIYGIPVHRDINKWFVRMDKVFKYGFYWLLDMKCPHCGNALYFRFYKLQVSAKNYTINGIEIFICSNSEYDKCSFYIGWNPEQWWELDYERR